MRETERLEDARNEWKVGGLGTAGAWESYFFFSFLRVLFVSRCFASLSGDMTAVGIDFLCSEFTGLGNRSDRVLEVDFLLCQKEFSGNIFQTILGILFVHFFLCPAGTVFGSILARKYYRKNCVRIRLALLQKDKHDEVIRQMFTAGMFVMEWRISKFKHKSINYRQQILRKIVLIHVIMQTIPLGMKFEDSFRFEQSKFHNWSSSKRCFFFF